jgi:hypothetical protein
LAQIPKRNCCPLAQLRRADLEINAAVIEDATKLTFSELKRRYPALPAPTLASEKKVQVVLCLSRPAARALKSCMRDAKKTLERLGEAANDDAALMTVLQPYIDAQEIGDSQAVMLDADPSSATATSEKIM